MAGKSPKIVSSTISLVLVEYFTSLPKGFDPRKEGLLKTMEAAGATKGSGNPFKPFQNRASGV